MLKFKFYLLVFFLTCVNITFGQTIIADHFTKVIVSPHIQAVFIQGDEEKITIEKNLVGDDKLNIKVNNQTLRIYLDDAKELTKNETVYENGHQIKRPVYKGTMVVATVTYKNLDALSVRGEETILGKGVLKGKDLSLTLYGESRVLFDEVHLENLYTTTYGESLLVITSGSIGDQKYVAYGESKINSLGTAGNRVKIRSYGESNFEVNVSDEIKFTAFGNARLKYKGNPSITKGLNIGEVDIERVF
jgi:hypothetical protein